MYLVMQRYVAQLVTGTGGPYGGDIAMLVVDVVPYTSSIVRVTMRDANASRWEVPDVVLLQPDSKAVPKYNVLIGGVGSNLNLVVTRLIDNVVIFDTRDSGGLVYEDQYLSMETVLPANPNIYGLGERAAPLRLPTSQVYTIFARDNATPLIQNVYGSHAFYMELRGHGAAHGVYLLNSNAMDVILNTTSLQYRVIGGVFDFFFFVGTTPKEVVRQYLSVIGKTEMIPYWGLGWQQCRWGYYTLAETKAVVDSYAANGIPLEVMWNDIDYMDGYKDFTVDPNRYPAAQFKSFIDSLHAKGQKYIMIIDPGIKIESGYAPYEDGLHQGLYITSNSTGKPLVGMVWPGFTFFPDFTIPATSEYWYHYLAQFHETIPFDGIWIDMNEVANFCDGNCLITPPIPSDRLVAQAASNILASQQVGANKKRMDPRQALATRVAALQPAQQAHLAQQNQNQQKLKHLKQQGVSHRAAAFDPNNPPYKPWNGGNALYSHTIDLSAMQHLGMQYNVHTLYGHYEGKATRAAADRILGKRSLVVSRSTFPGSGRHMSHWLGDNHSTWEDLHLSIAGVITMGMFGLPHVGADICGFVGNTTKELCTRWIQLGAFYPFSRDHNAVGMIPQEPYVFGPDVAKIAANTILLKYSFLPYYYTLHYHAHTIGDPVARGLFYEFPEDTITAENDMQMLIGPGMLLTPVLTESTTIVNAYLPVGYWYDFYTGVQTISTDGQYVQLDAPMDKINIHLRGGFIIPRQKPDMTINLSRKNPYNLYVALNESGSAVGDLFVDDGESFNTVTKKAFTFVTFTLFGNTLTIKPTVVGYPNMQPLTAITFLGVTQQPNQVIVNGQVLSHSLWTYSKSIRRLSIQGISIDLKTPSTVSWN